MSEGGGVQAAGWFGLIYVLRSTLFITVPLHFVMMARGYYHRKYSPGQRGYATSEFFV